MHPAANAHRCPGWLMGVHRVTPCSSVLNFIRLWCQNLCGAVLNRAQGRLWRAPQMRRWYSLQVGEGGKGMCTQEEWSPVAFDRYTAGKRVALTTLRADGARRLPRWLPGPSHSDVFFFV